MSTHAIYNFFDTSTERNGNTKNHNWYIWTHCDGYPEFVAVRFFRMIAGNASTVESFKGYNDKMSECLKGKRGGFYTGFIRGNDDAEPKSEKEIDNWCCEYYYEIESNGYIGVYEIDDCENKIIQFTGDLADFINAHKKDIQSYTGMYEPVLKVKGEYFTEGQALLEARYWLNKSKEYDCTNPNKQSALDKAQALTDAMEAAKEAQQ